MPMDYDIPVVAQTTQPTASQQVSDALEELQGHRHRGSAFGDADKLGADSLNIQGDLSLNSNNLDDARAIRFTDQDDEIDGVGDICSLYFLDGNFHVKNGSGSDIQITDGTSLNVTTGNTILATQTVASNHTILTTDTYIYLLVNTAGDRTITLPSANGVAGGRYYVIADVTGGLGANAITINRAGSDTINGTTSYVMRSAYGAVVVKSNGSNAWHVQASYGSIISLGSAPARSGSIALSNNTKVRQRNAANTQDLDVIYYDGSNNLHIGDQSGNGNSVSIYAQNDISAIANDDMTLWPQGTLTLIAGAAGADILASDGTDLDIGNLSDLETMSLEAITQIDVTVGSARLLTMTENSLVVEDDAHLIIGGSSNLLDIYQSSNSVFAELSSPATDFTLFGNNIDITLQASGTGNIAIAGNAGLTLSSSGTTLIELDATGLGFYGVPPVARSATYTVTNPSTDRAFDVSSAAIGEVRAVLGTLIADLKLTGIIG